MSPMYNMSDEIQYVCDEFWLRSMRNEETDKEWENQNTPHA